LVANGTSRHFAATQQSVALGVKADIKSGAPERAAELGAVVSRLHHELVLSSEEFMEERF
jgi:hypothetical protein